MPDALGPGARAPRRRHVLLRARLPGLRGVGQVVSRCRQLLDLDADACAINAVLAADGAARPAGGGPARAARARHVRRVRACRARRARPAGVGARRPDPGGTAGRPGSAPGCRCRTGRRRCCSPGPPTWRTRTCPGSASPRPGRRRCARWAPPSPDGTLELDHGADPQQTAARLAELPGIGPWTISYILMRAVGDPDAFPASDLGLRRALERLGGSTAQADRWRPWRAYAAVHLWTWYAGTPATEYGSPLAGGIDGRRIAAR